jgi:hypothetical protein
LLELSGLDFSRLMAGMVRKRDASRNRELDAIPAIHSSFNSPPAFPGARRRGVWPARGQRVRQMAAALARRQRPPSHHPRLFRLERDNAGLAASVNRSQAASGNRLHPPQRGAGRLFTVLAFPRFTIALRQPSPQPSSSK